MKPYSKDLRLEVLAAIDRGMPRAEAARVFGVSLPTTERYLSSLVEAIGRALDAVTSRDARGRFARCGGHPIEAQRQ